MTAVVTVTVAAGGLLAFRLIDDVKSPYATENAAAAERGSRTPLGRPPRTPHGEGTFEFTAEQPMSEEPVAYDPCRTVEWAIQDPDQLAPPGTELIVEEAARRVARATGLVFVHRETGEHADFHSVTLNYGRSPVIIDWTTPAEVRSLGGSTAGVGASLFSADSAGVRRYVTGAVALDTHQIRGVLDRPNGAARARAIVMHAFGQVVGLDDVDDPRELMFSGALSRLDFGPGDREGLALLGSGPCAR